MDLGANINEKDRVGTKENKRHCTSSNLLSLVHIGEISTSTSSNVRHTHVHKWLGSWMTDSVHAYAWDHCACACAYLTNVNQALDMLLFIILLQTTRFTFCRRPLLGVSIWC